ncbi:hypothetical protein ACFWBN_02200 [Streptomyces sp. NPDC059989]|uniref:hypothetical protein n=1 Tax=Streptomyces sp. NPDC059989 TaxID=3347026 RepID=UPI00369A9032
MTPFLQRYVASLTGGPARARPVAAARGRLGYGFGQRYWAALTGATLPEGAASDGPGVPLGFREFRFRRLVDAVRIVSPRLVIGGAMLAVGTVLAFGWQTLVLGALSLVGTYGVAALEKEDLPRPGGKGKDPDGSGRPADPDPPRGHEGGGGFDSPGGDA